MNLNKYVDKKKLNEEILLCPYCNGLGYEIEEKRVHWDETEYTRKECYLCKGKRVVNKKVTTEYLVVE